MYICFQCGSDHDSVKLLVVHLKCVHLLKSNDVYKCAQSNCMSEFFCVNSFKRHLENTHKYISTNYQNTNNINFPQPSEVINSIQFNSQISDSSLLFSSDIKEKLFDCALEFTLKLYNKSHMTTVQVEEIINDITKLFENIFKSLQLILPFINSERKSFFEDLLKFCSNPFQNISTSYKLKKYLEATNILREPQKYEIDRTNQLVNRCGVSQFSEKKISGTILPIRFMIKKVFETADNLDSTLSYIKEMESSNNSTVSDFLHGDLWKNKRNNYPNELCINYNLYYDDFETGNPLSGHTGIQAIAAFYINFPSLSRESCAQLDNIYPVLFAKTSDLKKFGSNKCIQILLDELILLETEGIIFENEKAEIFHIRFILGLVVGDNLALNQLLGFAHSFGHNFYCRICMCPKITAQKQCVENKALIRNIEGYNYQINTQTYAETGIKFESILNQLPSFHVTKNYYSDIMHDAFEGIVKYGLMHSILYFIRKGFFSLDELNDKIEYFDYGEIEVRNKCAKIKVSHLKNKKLHMSAREAISFLHLFSLMLGHKVPKTDLVWKYILILDKLLEDIMAQTFTQNQILQLENSIKVHHKMYIRLFKDTLKPKHHLITHYGSIIRNCGPIKLLWCMRFESKNREMKLYTNVTMSRRNLSHSLAKKCSLKFAYNLMKNKNSKNNNFKIVKTKSQIDYFSEIINNDISITNMNKIVYCTTIEFKGTIFKLNYFVFKNDMFYKIIDIAFFENNIYLIVKEIIIGTIDCHYQCHIISRIREIYEIFPIDLFHKPFLSYNLEDGRKGFKLSNI